jgi:hypothetical protein
LLYFHAVVTPTRMRNQTVSSAVPLILRWTKNESH